MFDKVWASCEIPSISPPREIPAALATEPVGSTVMIGMEMVGPDVIEAGINDAILEEATVIGETVFDNPRAVIAVAKLELNNRVDGEPRTNNVPFEDREVTPVADAASPVLLLLWTKVSEPVGDTLVPAREPEPATEATLDDCNAELAVTFSFGAMDDAELAVLLCKVKPVETSQ